jgi:membrane-associated protease RseP (regulator of RpoE activity)
MSTRPDDPFAAAPPRDTELVPAEVVEPRVAQPPQRGIPPLPVILFLVTCYTTYRAGYMVSGSPALALWYALPLLGILLCHEFGHYLQALRYHVPASLPLFIPMPIGPIGTMGAVIAMRGHMGSRKALFDIGISGPLAGLGPALVCCVVGLAWSHVGEIPKGPTGGMQLGEPLLFQWLAHWYFGPLPETQTVFLHPLAFAGWVGVFLTAINLFPISQLDGGHVMYALLREKAHFVAWGILTAAFLFVALTGRYEWSLMLFLLVLIGPSHPPTANDNMPLGTFRTILGWLTLSFVIVGFTPTPFM